MLAFLAIASLIVVYFAFKITLEFIKEHGIEMIVLRFMLGRHPGHHHRQRNTNATFWRDSDGKIHGKQTGRISKRHHRAGWKNLVRMLGYVAGSIGFIYGFFNSRTITLVLTVTLILALLGYKIVTSFMRAKTWYQNKGIVAPLSAALSAIPGMPDEDMEKSITLKPDFLKIKRGELGRVYFPNRFEANENERTAVEKLIELRFPVPVELKWHTKKTPQYAAIMAAPLLPRMILFMDHLDDIAKCKNGEYLAGYDKDNKPVYLSHLGDFPHKGFSMGSATGKSTLLRSIAAQILNKDPSNEITVIDTKRVSLAIFDGVPGVHLFNDPKNMSAMWKALEELKAEMDRRYEIYVKDRSAKFPLHWLFMEEENDFSVQVNGYWKFELRDKGDPMMAPIWYNTIAPLLWQGREVGIFVICVAQYMLERNFGNLGLRTSFGTIGMAGYKTNQWRTIVGTSPIPPVQEGQGRIMIIEGPREVWIQGLYAEESVLREYALKNRIIPPNIKELEKA